MTVQTLTDELLGEIEEDARYGSGFVAPSTAIVLIDELRTLRAENAAHGSFIAKQVATIRELRKDAGRYRHASKRESDGDVDICICRVDWNTNGYATYFILTGDNAHTAIDTAMEQAK
jgi:hypothetical protein